ncbi:hypothetical protein LCGC14_2265590, partial [marine sediment metagenome]
AASEAAIVSIDVAIAAESVMIKRSFDRYDAVLGATLPASLSDGEFDRDTDNETSVHWNATAETLRSK